MSWKHKRPLEDEPVYRPVIAPANTFVESCHDTAKPTVNLFGGPSPLSSNNHQESLSQEGPSGDVHPARLENVAAQRDSRRITG
jgi:hypothetical protein